MLVTGGSSGIGRGIAVAMASAGAHVVLVARNAAALEATQREVEHLGGRALSVVADLTKPGGPEAAASATLGRVACVDILVNNAGGSSGEGFGPGPLLDLAPDDLDRCMDLNVKSAFLMSRLLVPAMVSNRGGCIINIASMAGLLHSPPVANMGFYPMSKTALIALTRTMAVEWAPDVRVNAIAPGVIATPGVVARGMTSSDPGVLAGVPLRRLGTPADVADAALYLASGATWVTGTVVEVHGGLPPAVRHVHI